MPRLFKRADRWYGEWRDARRYPTRKTLSMDTKDKRIAQKRFMQLCVQQAEGKFDPWFDPTPQDNVRLSDAVGRFIKSRQTQRCRPKTLKVYKETLRLLENALPPGILLSQIDHRHIQKLVNNEVLSAASRGSYHRRFRTFFSWCVQQRLLKHNVMEAVRAPKKMKQEATYLTAEQADKLLRCIEADATKHEDGRKRNMQWLADLVRFSLFTGMRRGEAINLRWDAVDLENGFVVIKNSENFTTKSGHERRVPLVAGARNVLERLAVERLNTQDNDYVLTNESGSRLYGPFVSKRFRDYRRMAGLPEGISVHTLRHTAASWMVMKGVPLLMVQTILGHSSSATTRTYAHLAQDALKREMERAFDDNKVAEPFRLFSALPAQKGAETCSTMQLVKAA